MALLIAGVVLWIITHLSPAAVPQLRANLTNKLGEWPYKGLFALDIILALVLIVMGWKAAAPSAIYAPPLYGSPYHPYSCFWQFSFLPRPVHTII